MLPLPHGGLLQYPRRGGGRGEPDPQRTLRPNSEHHQREDLPPPLVLVRLHGSLVNSESLWNRGNIVF